MSGLDNMKKRMLFTGGGLPTSDGRNVDGKLRSFQSALWNSYQAEWITFKDKQYRCLINPDKLKENYDQKVISIDFEAGMKGGDTFYWDRTQHHWLVFLEEYAEEAYFRASIRRCDYEILGYPVYLRGPVETAIIWRQKHQLETNDLNYSILFYITKNEETLAALSRFKMVKFDGHNWRVAATDKYSQPGIIEVYLEEYYDNPMEDAMLPKDIPTIEIDTASPHIEGKQIVEAFEENLAYSVVGKTGGRFVASPNKSIKIRKSTDNTCVIDILVGKEMQIDLMYKVDGDSDIITFPISVQSL